MCHFLAPAGQLEMVHENFMHISFAVCAVHMRQILWENRRKPQRSGWSSEFCIDIFRQYVHSIRTYDALCSAPQNGRTQER